MELKRIGIIHSPFTEAKGAPIQPRAAEGAAGTVEVFEPFVAGLRDLEGFERVWLLYWFDRAAPFKPVVKPFMDDEARGLFATRAPCRPNPIGMSAVRVLRIERNVLHVADIDVLGGTPLLDIKPYAPQFDSFEGARSGWLDAAAQARRVESTRADERFARDAE